MLKKLVLFFLVSIFLISSIFFVSLAKYPEKPLELIVAFSAGGSTDIMARLIAEGLEKELGQKVAVINKPGAGGEIGFTALAKAKADGYTIGAVNLPTLITITYLRPNTVKYSVDDFEKIANIVLDPATFTVNADSPFQTLTDLIEYANEHPGAVTIGSSGVGTSGHMNILYFDSIMNLKTTAVPFEGDAPVRAALLGNHIMASAIKISEASVYLEEGSMRTLGVMAAERLPDYPDIPTFKEQGVDMVSASARGIATPKGVPKDIIEILSKAIEKVVNSDEFIKKAKDMNMPLNFMLSNKYKEFFMSQDEFTKKFLKATGKIK